jgi:hypothetical protein
VRSSDESNYSKMKHFQTSVITVWLLFCLFSLIFSITPPNRGDMNPSTAHNLRALSSPTPSWYDSTTRKYTLAVDDNDAKYLGNPALPDSISMEYWVCFIFNLSSSNLLLIMVNFHFFLEKVMVELDLNLPRMIKEFHFL